MNNAPTIPTTARNVSSRTAKDAYYYAYNVIEGRWPEAEATIMRDSYYAYQYAHNVIKGRWPEAEAEIKTNHG